MLFNGYQDPIKKYAVYAKFQPPNEPKASRLAASVQWFYLRLFEAAERLSEVQKVLTVLGNVLATKIPCPASFSYFPFF